MIKKEKLLGQINNLLGVEKAIVPLLNRHISSSLFFSALKEVDRRQILESFQNLAVTQAKHADILNSIKNEITKGENNVY
jgi:hypothetical protein